MSKLKIGLLLPNWTGAMNGHTPRVSEVVAMAQLAEQLGFDTVWVADHFYYEPYTDFAVVGVELPDEFDGVKNGAWECWTLMSAIAAATSRVQLGTLVSNTGFRNPALLARMADTVDDLSDGRLILGLGAGDFITEHRAFGFPFDRRVGRFEEALSIILPLLRGETVSLDGTHYQVHEAQLMPKAARAEGPEIMIGTLKGAPRMSRLVAQHAQLWNCNIAFGDSGIDNYRAAWQPIEQACHKHDRDPGTLARHATIGVNLLAEPYPVPNAQPFTGDTQQIAARFVEYAAAGVDHVSIMPHPWTCEGLELFAPVIDALRSMNDI